MSIKIRTLLSTIIIAAVLIGCSSKEPQPVNSDLTLLYSPEIGVSSTVEIGQNMFSKTYAFQNLIFVNGKAKAKLNNYIHIDAIKEYTFIDTRLRKTKEGYNAVCYSWFCSTDTNNDSFLDSWWKVKKQLIGENVYSPLEEKVPYKLGYSFDENSFKYDALYQGKIDNKIKISFREFKNNIARPAFTQNIDYELEKSGTTIIGFKGLRIEVINVTNTSITYRVIKDYD